jgi:nucleotide-binding universal stress UspA family protein
MTTDTLSARTSIQLRNILMATDFSPAADAALPWAASLARHYCSTLYAVHVCPRTFPPTMRGLQNMEPGDEWSAIAEATERQARERLENSVREFRGTHRRVVVCSGEVWPVVAELLEKYDIDLMVIGTRGRTGLEKLLLGSEAETIFRSARCPVLTVGPHSRDLPKAGEFQNILFASNFSTESVKAASYGISLAQESKGALTLLHVVERPKACELIIPEDLISFSAHSLAQLVPQDVTLARRPAIVVEVGDPARKILEFAAKNKSDLIVLGVHRPKRLAVAATHLPMATAHKVVAHASCPVLTVR